MSERLKRSHLRIHLGFVVPNQCSIVNINLEWQCKDKLTTSHIDNAIDEKDLEGPRHAPGTKVSEQVEKDCIVNDGRHIFEPPKQHEHPNSW